MSEDSSYFAQIHQETTVHGKPMPQEKVASMQLAHSRLNTNKIAHLRMLSFLLPRSWVSLWTLPLQMLINSRFKSSLRMTRDISSKEELRDKNLIKFLKKLRFSKRTKNDS